MGVQRSGTNHPMSTAVTSGDQFLLRLLSDAEDAKISTGIFTDRNEARAAVAREAKIAPGTIENLRRGRSKGLRGFVRDRIIAFVVADLQRQIARAEHDLDCALRMAQRPDEAAIFEAKAAVATARRLAQSLLGQMTNSSDA